MKRRRALLLLALAAVSPIAQAQTGKWPEKPVRIVVPTGAGTGTDRIARMLAARLSVEFGQQFIVDNRAGASGMIGAEIVVRAIPDGYTLAVASPTFATSATLYKLPYDPTKDIAPIAMIATGPLILAVHPSVKATNLKEFIELARAKPNALTVGSSGAGSDLHLAAALFQQMTKTDMVHVPYKGQAAALVDLLGGQIQLLIDAPPVAMPYVKAGRVKAIAVVNPNNPTGSFLKPNEREELDALALKKGLAILSDEVFSDYSFTTGVTTSLVDGARALTFSMSGLSKIAGLPQMKLGWIVASGDQHNKALEGLEWIADTFLSVSTPVQVGLRRLLAAGDLIRAEIQQRTKANLEFLKSKHPVLHCEGGWYAVMQIPRTHGEEEWAMTLLRQDNVRVQPGFFYDFESEAYLVLSLLSHPLVFREGVKRIVQRIS